MKNNLLLLLSSSMLVFSSTGAAAPACALVSFRSAPLNLDNVPTSMEVSAKATSTNKLLVEVYIINDLYTSGVKIANFSFSSDNQRSFVYENEYTRSSNKIKIIWKEIKTRVTKSETFDIDLSIGENFRLNSSVYTHESTANVITYIPGSGVRKSKQKITFYNFEDKYVPNFYHKIDLSTFQIENNSSFPSALSCKSAIFSITNVDNVFEKFGTDSKIQLPLVLVSSNDKFSLSFESNLYVNPITLEMSPTFHTGFVETKHFYLPRASKQTEETYECVIRINSFGLDNDDFMVSFRYKSLLNTFGDCRNSEYCIVNT